MAEPRVTVAAEIVRQRIEALKAVYPELVEDADLLAGTIEGETDFGVVIERIVSEALESAALADGTHDYLSAIRERRDRLLRKNKALRGLAFDLMKAAGKDKIQLPIATLSIRTGGHSVVVDDVNELPQGMYRREPSLSSIKAAIKNGDEVPGAHLEPSIPSLSIRTA